MHGFKLHTWLQDIKKCSDATETLTVLIFTMPKATQREIAAPDGIAENPGGSTFKIYQESKPLLPSSQFPLYVKAPLPPDLTI